MLRRPVRSLVTLAMGSLLLTGVVRSQTVPVSSEPYGDFSEKIAAYVKLHQTMPSLRPKRQRKQIVDTRKALVGRIREARATARQGDIFTPLAAAEFRRVIRTVFQGAGAAAVRKTAMDGDSVEGWHLTVNCDYPDDLPVTTVPPTLLLLLPQLPPEVAYRIIGHDFVLQDKEARLVIDFIPGALP